MKHAIRNEWIVMLLLLMSTGSDVNAQTNFVWGRQFGSVKEEVAYSTAVDASGNLYGTTFADGQYGRGSVFKLTPSLGGWSYTSLHDFTGGSDGSNPMCSLTFDSEGNIYGTASGGGSHGQGVVFKIAP